MTIRTLLLPFRLLKKLHDGLVDLILLFHGHSPPAYDDGEDVAITGSITSTFSWLSP